MEPGVTTAFDWWTLVIAVVGLALGLVNLGMRLFEWRRSGARVKVSLKGGWLDPTGGMAVVPIEGYNVNQKPTMTGRAVFVIEATNRGRAAADVTQWWMTIGPARVGMARAVDERAIEALIDAKLHNQVRAHLGNWALSVRNVPCPYRLQSFAQQQWVLDSREVEETAKLLSAAGEDTTLGALMVLGDGREIEARQRVDPSTVGI